MGFAVDIGDHRRYLCERIEIVVRSGKSVRKTARSICFQGCFVKNVDIAIEPQGHIGADERESSVRNRAAFDENGVVMPFAVGIFQQFHLERGQFVLFHRDHLHPIVFPAISFCTTDRVFSGLVGQHELPRHAAELRQGQGHGFKFFLAALFKRHIHHAVSERFLVFLKNGLEIDGLPGTVQRSVGDDSDVFICVIVKSSCAPVAVSGRVPPS